MSKHTTVASRVEAMVRFARAMNSNSAFTDADRAEALSNAQAEGVTTHAALRTHILLDTTMGNSRLVSLWLESIEMGGFPDNYQAYTLCQFQIANGETELGVEGLRRLRAHIVEHPEELKSQTHLLPRVEEAIARAAA